MANCKYEKLQYQVSYDSGSTWENVTPIQVRKGDIIESPSSDCSEIQTLYRWVELEGTYICDGNNKYTRRMQEESYDDGVSWYASYPTVYSIGTFIGVDADYCCDKFVGHYEYDETMSFCPNNYIWNGYKCVYVDPIKVLKCDGNTTLTNGNLQYYNNNYRLIACEIGDSVTSIEDRAFEGYSGLTSCIIGNGVTSIGLAAFLGCTGLTSIHIPSACTKFHGYCFSGCTSLTSLTIDSYEIDSNTGDGNWYYGQFSNCRNLQEVSFTNLRQGCIPPNCFSGCWALSSVTLGNPTCISEMAFSSCQSLTSIDLGSNITSIGNRAFSNCTSLTDVYIRQTANILSGVYNNSFPSSTRIHVPCVVWFDWYKAYNIDHNLGNDIIPIENDCLPYESLIYEWRAASINTEYECVGYDKHYKEYKYVSIDSGETWYKTYETRVGALYQVNSVDCGYTGETKFRATYNDERVYLIPCTSSTLTYNETHPDGYTGENMINAIIGDCVTSIGNTAFRACSSLTSVIISDSVTSIGRYTFRECISITSIELPNNLNTIGVGAFRYCTSLTSITIPDSVTIIGLSDGFGDSTFGNCTSLINVTIGSGVTSIDNAFQGCTNLTSVIINAITPPTLDSSAFNNTSANLVIYVPCGSVDAYKAANNWSSYSSRIVGIPPCYEPQYRTISGTPYCSGYDKYVDVYDQVSYDSGSTWTTTATTPTLVEANSEDCGYIPTQRDYLAFVAQENGDFWFNGNSINYSLDSGSTWVTLADQQHSPTVSAGSKIMWKSTLTPSSGGIGKFYSSGRFTVEGNIMSLLYGDDFEDKTSLSGKDYAFKDLFYSCAKLESAENLSLPATTLANNCYYEMFYGCTSLTTAPELPATTLANNCYQYMFYGCTSLTTAPELPATALQQYCYYGMFQGCTSLTTTLVLSATTLAQYCCYSMFQGCTSLTTAPELPATTLENYCYRSMFQGCTSLTTAPELSATTLTDYCYRSMFQGCSSLNNVTCLATNISASMCLYKWLDGVANIGTFTKSASMSSWPSGSDGIPYGWTIQDA